MDTSIELMVLEHCNKVWSKNYRNTQAIEDEGDELEMAYFNGCYECAVKQYEADIAAIDRAIESFRHKLEQE